ncbi:MAG: PilT/PilU family type 4a pilus ATPase [Bdellovibrionota bacterium]|nr:PilT/PilU family type 4a pilus ATPase [Bdellovibrionota bacterium]
MELDHLLRYCIEKGASDLHLKVGTPPYMRLHGELLPLAPNIPQLSREYIEDLAVKILDERQRHMFEECKEIDIAYAVRGIGRFRVNIFRQRGSVSMVIRTISIDVPSLRQLGLPEVMKDIANNERGLILITGVTGSGKSTTMASMISQINNTKHKHIITIEDPIEFLLRDNKCIISQRELGVDTTSFSKALKAAMRQDPDVILIGEIRDKDTIETALMAAETGHLVISTLHTKDTKETINRILSYFPPGSHTHVRNLLAANLKAIISLRLAKRKDKAGFVPVSEVLINNSRISDMIMQGSSAEHFNDAIEESAITYKMQSFDQNLVELVHSDKITKEEAFRITNNRADFELRLKGLNPKGEKEWQEYHKEDGEENTVNRKAHRDEWDNIPDLELDLDSFPQESEVQEEPTDSKSSGKGFFRGKNKN